MNGYSNRSFSVIDGIDSLPAPFLVEISHKTKTKRKNLEIFGEAVCDFESGMFGILCELQDKLQLHDYRASIVTRFKDYVQNEKCEGQNERDEFYFRKLAIEIIVDKEINVLIKRKRTRRAVKYIRDLKNKVLIRRKLRMEEENHLCLSFYEDVLRTQNELRHVLS